MRWDLVRSLVIWLIAFSPLWILVGVLVYSVRRRRALAGVPDERKPAWLRGPSVRATLRDWWRLPVPKRVGDRCHSDRRCRNRRFVRRLAPLRFHCRPCMARHARAILYSVKG